MPRQGESDRVVHYNRHVVRLDWDRTTEPEVEPILRRAFDLAVAEEAGAWHRYGEDDQDCEEEGCCE